MVPAGSQHIQDPQKGTDEVGLPGGNIGEVPTVVPYLTHVRLERIQAPAGVRDNDDKVLPRGYLILLRNEHA